MQEEFQLERGLTAIWHERSTHEISTLCPPGPFAGLSNGLLIASIVSISLKLLLLLTVSYLGRTQAIVQNMKFVRMNLKYNIAP